MITVLGAANVDIQAFVSEHIASGDSAIGRISTSAGGVARNIAENLRYLGDAVRFITVLANDANSEILKSNMSGLGIDFSSSLVLAHARTSCYSCILDEKGALFAAVNDMAILDELSGSHLSQALSSLSKNDLVISDTNIQGDALKAVALSVKEAGARLVIDTVSCAKCVRAKSILEYVYAIKPNRAEAFTLSGIEVKNVKNAQKAASFFHDSGVKYVCISLGSEGVFYSGDSCSGVVSIANLPVINVSGAGDALAAGFVSALEKGASLQEAARFAQAAASICCSSEMAASPLLTQSYAETIAKTLHISDLQI